MAQPVVHFEVIGKDGKKLQEFYGKLFDWNVDASNPMSYGLVSQAATAASVVASPVRRRAVRR